MGNHTSNPLKVQALQGSMNQQEIELTLSVYRQMSREQSALVLELKELYALVNVCRLALKGHGQDETDTTSDVLMMASNRLFDLCEQEGGRADAMELLAYPWLAEGAQS